MTKRDRQPVTFPTGHFQRGYDPDAAMRAAVVAGLVAVMQRILFAALFFVLGACAVLLTGLLPS